jgi:hypothetical protein
MLANKEVLAQVKQFTTNTEGLKNIPEDRFFSICETKPITHEDLPNFHLQLVKKSSDISRAGTDVLHLFMAGPVSVAAMVGAEFANAGCQVIVYQNNHGNYINFGALKHRF